MKKDPDRDRRLGALAARRCEVGFELAAAEEAKAIVVHVAPASTPCPPAGSGSARRRLTHHLTAATGLRSARRVELAAENGLRGGHRVVLGDTPVNQITAYAEELDVDLIVVGSRGHGALTTALLGSVSLGVLRHTRAPCWSSAGTPPASAPERPLAPPSRIRDRPGRHSGRPGRGVRRGVGSGHGERRRGSRGRAPLSAEEVEALDAYWRAANYLSVGQIYLLDNPLLREPLTPEHVKVRLLGHFGTTPGLNLIYAHLNRAIKAARPQRDLHRRAGPRRARRSSPTRTSRAPTPRSTRRSSQDEDGMRRLFRQFSFPGGIPSHVAPETPGSIHEGGELGYSLAHAFGAAFDNPDLLVACVVGDGEAETGPARGELALEQVPEREDRRRGAADPAPQRLQDREPDRARPDPRGRSCSSLFRGYGFRPVVVEGGAGGEPPKLVHERFAAALDDCLDEIARIQQAARNGGVDRAAALADDDPADAEGLDRPEGGRRQADRGHVALAPGARSPTSHDNAGHLRHARAVAAELPARGALRRERRARAVARASCRRRARGG